MLRYTPSQNIAEQFPISIITELYPILTHCWGKPYLITLLNNSERLIHCWAILNSNTMLRYTPSQNITEQFPISIITELYPILTHCWGKPYLITLLSNSQILIHCWAILNSNTLLRYTPSQNIAEQFPISIITELYPIITHCWGKPYLITLLSNSQILIHCWAILNSNTLLRYTPSQNITEQFPISIITELYPILTHCWGKPYLITLLSNSQILIHCWAILNSNTLLRYTPSQNIAEQFPISIITELYPIITHCWGKPYLITLLSNSQILIHCWAILKSNTLLRYTPSQNITEQFPISIITELYPILTHCWGKPYLITLLSNSQILIHCWAILNSNTLLRYTPSQNIAEQFPISIITELYPILTHCWGIP